jgi:hypothetical protein
LPISKDEIRPVNNVNSAAIDAGWLRDAQRFARAYLDDR